MHLKSDARRIVSLSPTATEMLFAIGAGERVVATDSASSYPKYAPRTDLSGLSPNAEAVANYRPDLVVVDADRNGSIANLTKLNVPVMVEPAAKTLNDTYDQIADFGLATNRKAKADNVVAKMKTDVADAIAGAGSDMKKLSYYHEVDNTYYSVTSATFVGNIYSMFALANIADRAKTTAGNTYPQLSAEYILNNDPDLIFLADTPDESAATVAKRPGWGNLTAVKQKQVIELDSDTASRWGPRVVAFISKVADAVRQARAKP